MWETFFLYVLGVFSVPLHHSLPLFLDPKRKFSCLWENSFLWKMETKVSLRWQVHCLIFWGGTSQMDLQKPKLQLLFNHSCTSCQSNSVQVQFQWYSVMSHWHGIVQLPILDNKYLLTAFPIHKFYNLGDIQQLIQLSAQHYLFHH